MLFHMHDNYIEDPPALYRSCSVNLDNFTAWLSWFLQCPHTSLKRSRQGAKWTCLNCSVTTWELLIMENTQIQPSLNDAIYSKAPSDASQGLSLKY